MTKPLIIFLDDDCTMRLTAGGILEETFGDAEVQALEDWHAANQLITRHRERMVVLVCDVSMPGIDGCSFVSTVFKFYKHVRIIMLTGEDEDRVRKRLPSDKIPILQKSNGPQGLILAIRCALAAGARP